MFTNAKEYSWAAVVSILILAFSSLPVLAGHAAQTPEQHFIGTFFDRQDYAVHIAMMHYGEEGNWGYQMRFTTEPHTSAHVRTFYVVLGHLGGWLHIPSVVLFQIARLFFGFLACLGIYRLLTRVFNSIDERRLAFVLAMLGSGVGWFQLISGLVPSRISPVDLWLIDAYPLFSMALFPHFSAVLAAIAIAITAFLDQMVLPRWQNMVVLAGCALFVQVVNPIAFILADLAMAGAFTFSCWKNRRLDWQLVLTLSLIACLQIPLLMYSFQLLTSDPAWAIYSRQNMTLSPGPIYYLLGFGLFWPFAIAGAIKTLRERVPAFGWALFWVVFAFGLAYLPVNIQRRFLLGITLPLAVLATPALLELSHWLSAHLQLRRNTGAVLIGALASISSLVLIGSYTINMKNHPVTLFEPAALVEATDWLAKNGSPLDVVLASEETAQVVAIRTPLRLYFGHEMETLHYAEKAAVVERFYRGEQPAGWLESEGITWVILGPHEAVWQPGLNDASGAEIAYQKDQVFIYRVSPP